MSLVLRQELQRLTTPPACLDEQSNPDAWMTWLADQIDNVIALARNFPHHIEIYERSNSSTRRLNCFAFAFGMDATTIGAGPCPDHLFVWRLLEDHLEEKAVLIDEASDDDIIIYYNSRSPTHPRHAGKYRNGQVISKWGWGQTHTWKHPPLEVPEEYGDMVKVYKPISRSHTICVYEGWAATYGP